MVGVPEPYRFRVEKGLLEAFEMRLGQRAQDEALSR